MTPNNTVYRLHSSWITFPKPLASFSEIFLQWIERAKDVPLQHETLSHRLLHTNNIILVSYPSSILSIETKLPKVARAWKSCAKISELRRRRTNEFLLMLRPLNTFSIFPTFVGLHAITPDWTIHRLQINKTHTLIRGINMTVEALSERGWIREGSKRWVL
jgi:hypothetical protein